METWDSFWIDEDLKEKTKNMDCFRINSFKQTNPSHVRYAGLFVQIFETISPPPPRQYVVNI